MRNFSINIVKVERKKKGSALFSQISDIQSGDRENRKKSMCNAARMDIAVCTYASTRSTFRNVNFGDTFYAAEIPQKGA